MEQVLYVINLLWEQYSLFKKSIYVRKKNKKKRKNINLRLRIAIKKIINKKKLKLNKKKHKLNNKWLRFQRKLKRKICLLMHLVLLQVKLCQQLNKSVYNLLLELLLDWFNLCIFANYKPITNIMVMFITNYQNEEQKSYKKICIKLPMFSLLKRIYQSYK